jgi:nucleolar protein 15
MHNYLLFGRLLQCKIKVVPEGKEGKLYIMKLWKGANKKFKAFNGNKRHAESFNQERSELQKELRAERLVAKERKLKRKLKELDIEYDFTGYEGCVPKKPVTAE